MDTGVAHFWAATLDWVNLAMVGKVSAYSFLSVCVIHTNNHHSDVCSLFYIEQLGGLDGSAGQKGESGSSGSEDTTTDEKTADDGFSQAESSIKNGEVIASAQGTKNGGTAQTQGNHTPLLMLSQQICSVQYRHNTYHYSFGMSSTRNIQWQRLILSIGPNGGQRAPCTGPS